MALSEEDFGKTALNSKGMEEAIRYGISLMGSEISVDKAFQELKRAPKEHKDHFEQALAISQKNADSLRRSLDFAIRNNNLNRLIVMEAVAEKYEKTHSKYVSKVRAQQTLEA